MGLLVKHHNPTSTPLEHKPSSPRYNVFVYCLLYSQDSRGAGHKETKYCAHPEEERPKLKLSIHSFIQKSSLTGERNRKHKEL